MRVAATAVLLGLASFACTPDERQSTPTAPRFDLSVAGSVSGNLLGPDGTSICHFIPDGSELFVRVLYPPPAAPDFAGSQLVDCPDSSFAIALEPGSYFLRITLPGDPAIGLLPVRYLVANPVSVSSAEVHEDVRILPGSTLQGRATLNGAPFAGADITVAYDQPPGYNAAFGISGDDGGWVDEAGRDPMVLQDSLRYVVATPCEALGTTVLQGPPAGAFLFPQQNTVNCTFGTAPSVRFSHTRTRLAITPMPGDIGGLSDELLDQYGMGWGVQFPAPPIPAARSLSQLYEGGLIVGIRPDRILTGFDMSGYADCGATCRDFGLDGKLNYNTSRQFGTKAIWHYSDATSAERVGLKVLQKSYDGTPPHDYVLFHFIFTNSSGSPITFYAGTFTDWDIGDDPTDDIGGTDVHGRLMYMTDQAGGVYAGTLILGAPVSGNAFFTDFGQSTATQLAALDGDLLVPTAPDPGDHRYIHAAGPITLRAGKSGDIWVAIVAGETHEQLLANTAAAAADVMRRGDDLSDDNDALGGSATAVQTGRPILYRNLRCKKRCVR